MSRVLRIDWRFLTRWVLTNLIGTSVGMAVGAIVGTFVFFALSLSWGSSGNQDGVILTATMAVAAVVAGFLLGAAQVEVLRERTPVRNGWVVATSFGFGAAILGGAGIYFALQQFPQTAQVVSRSGEIVLFAAGGLVVGSIWSAVQWLVLRHHVANAHWWILMNALLTPVAAVIERRLALSVPFGTYGPGVGLVIGMSEAPGILAAVLLWSVVTSLLLTRLLRRRKYPREQGPVI